VPLRVVRRRQQQPDIRPDTDALSRPGATTERADLAAA